ncbi:unnamed protein product [marine sediment metagenome]|uniref:Uncharacterized protein n=1 Tax=marine sediment metagenome TaxID=412755 RepID=X0XB29_9ZZZZ
MAVNSKSLVFEGMITMGTTYIKGENPFVFAYLGLVESFYGAI